jgi:hypothetical protein
MPDVVAVRLVTAAPSVSSSLGELVFHPIHGQVLVLLVVPLEGDEACHEADDVQHHSIVSTSLVRSESAWMTHFLRLVALAKQESLLAFCDRHGLAQSPRLALVYSPLIGDDLLEHRALRGGHRGERQLPLTGSAGRKKLKVERLRHGSARRTNDPFSTCHNTTLVRLTRRPSLPTPDATQRTFVRR